MTLFKRLIQRVCPDARPVAQEPHVPHPNFWMYQ